MQEMPQYLDVIALFNSRGIVRPMAVQYGGKQWPITVTKVEKSTTKQGIGTVYSCRIGKERRRLWRVGDRWWVEPRP